MYELGCSAHHLAHPRQFCSLVYVEVLMISKKIKNKNPTPREKTKFKNLLHGVFTVSHIKPKEDIPAKHRYLPHRVRAQLD